MSAQGDTVGRIPKATVLMAVYNAERYLREAIESILGQTFTDFEFLVINDGSTDSSRTIILSYPDPRIRLIDNIENIGLTKSLNCGLSFARGEYVARQDADDISHPDRLQKQVSFLDLHREIAVLGVQARIIGWDGRVIAEKADAKAISQLEILWQVMFDSPFFHSSVIFRKEVVWGKYLGYNEEYLTSQDFELWSRLLPECRLSNLDEVLLDHRTHSGSVSSNYSVDNINRVKKVFIRNIEYVVGDVEIASKFSGLWLSLTNPGRLVISCSEVQMVVKLLESMRNTFIEEYPNMHSNKFITKHLAQKIVHCSFYMVDYSRIKAIKIFFKAVSLDCAVFGKYMNKFLVSILLGQRNAVSIRRLLWNR